MIMLQSALLQKARPSKPPADSALTWAHTHTHTHTHTHSLWLTHIITHHHTQTHVDTFDTTWMKWHTHTHPSVHTHTHTLTHTHTHTHTHTYTHTHTHFEIWANDFSGLMSFQITKDHFRSSKSRQQRAGESPSLSLSQNLFFFCFFIQESKVKATKITKRGDVCRGASGMVSGGGGGWGGVWGGVRVGVGVCGWVGVCGGVCV